MKLIELLKQVNADPTIPQQEWLTAGDGEEYNREDDAIIDEIVGLACEELIESDGRCNWTNIQRVKDAGLTVVAGDKDSFGWLTGVIYTQKGRICYG